MDTAELRAAAQEPVSGSRQRGPLNQWICFQALQLMGLLQSQPSRTAGQHLTIDELATELQQGRQMILLYPNGGAEKRFRPMSPVQERLYRELSLEELT